MASNGTRVLIAKPGLDGHDRGAKVLVRALREYGFEVAYTGIRQTADDIAAQAHTHNASLVGLSILSGAHLELTHQVLDALERHGLGGVPVMVGGIIPEADRRALLEMGVVAVFGPGTTTSAIADAIRQTLIAVQKR